VKKKKKVVRAKRFEKKRSLEGKEREGSGGWSEGGGRVIAEISYKVWASSSMEEDCAPAGQRGGAACSFFNLRKEREDL